MNREDFSDKSAVYKRLLDAWRTILFLLFKHSWCILLPDFPIKNFPPSSRCQSLMQLENNWMTYATWEVLLFRQAQSIEKMYVCELVVKCISKATLVSNYEHPVNKEQCFLLSFSWRLSCPISFNKRQKNFVPNDIRPPNVYSIEFTENKIDFSSKKKFN